MNQNPADGFYNLLEPPAFAALFALHPPHGFVCRPNAAGLPMFFTQFDLLTTLEEAIRNRLARLPFFRTWSARLRFAACFAGTTVTEYAPLPRHLTPEALIAVTSAEHADRRSLAIIKDLPLHSPLLPEQDNAFASKLAALAADHGFIEVVGQALAYMRLDFASTDAYLERLSAGRRKDLRRKLKKRGLLDVEILRLGDARFADPAFLDELYAMYLAVFAQSSIHFDLLSREFFTALLQSRAIGGVVFLYRYGERLVGHNLCLIQGGMLIDKYIGFAYPLARDLNLYFISWLINLEFALANGLHTYIAGWTDPEVKAGLGASFTFTRHLVWVKNPLLRSLLRPLRHCFESDRRTLRGVP
ncbi:MAG: GNAT family N-acetyltransferase [Deltaproteobacteria bacterium]|nr:GNAT family N-acetyltransferase [Deltaproteobacteria bacterium]